MVQREDGSLEFRYLVEGSRDDYDVDSADDVVSLGNLISIDVNTRRIVGLKQIEQRSREITGLEWILLDTECEANPPA